MPPALEPSGALSVYLPLLAYNPCLKGTAGITATAVSGDLWYDSILTMGVCFGYEWNHAYTPTHLAYSRPWQVINDIRSKVLTTPSLVITWNVSLDLDWSQDGCPGSTGYSPTLRVYDPTPGGQAALRACLRHVAATVPGMYWLVWNEPDDWDQDRFSPAQGAQFFREISNTILGGDPTARLIVGNVLNRYYDNPTQGCPNNQGAPVHYGCGEYWLTQFISEALVLGYDPRPAIAGYGFHIYSWFTNNSPPPCNIEDAVHSCHDAYLKEAFTRTAITFTNWVNAHDAGKEIWLTEINWYPKYPWEQWDVQERRMSDICSTLATLPIERYFWFYGSPPYEVAIITNSLFLDGSGALSRGGQRYAQPPAPSGGGCPVSR